MSAFINWSSDALPPTVVVRIKSAQVPRTVCDLEEADQRLVSYFLSIS